MGDRAFDPAAKGLVRLAKLLKLAVGRRAPATRRRAFDTGKSPLDPADGNDGAFIWHQARNSTPEPLGKLSLTDPHRLTPLHPPLKERPVVA